MPSNRKIVLANGEYYHLFNRGVEKRNVFTNKYEFSRALNLVNFYCFHKPIFRYSKYLVLNKEQRQIFWTSSDQKVVDIIAFCFMNNHFHFLVRQAKDNGISKFMANFTNSYTKYFNTKHQRVGALFQGAFKAVHVDSEEQLFHLSRYIHLNPVTGFLIKPQELKNYKWSSYPNYVGNTSLDWIDNEVVLDSFKKRASYENFVLDQVDYAKELANIEHLIID